MTEHNGAASIYFDTNIFRDAFEGSDEKSNQLKSIFEIARQQPQRIITSELTLAELLGKEALGKGWIWQKRFYLGLIVFSRFIDLRPITREILEETGEYRRAARQGNRSVKLPDAIHVVTAIKARCQYVFTADKRFVVPAPLQVIASDAAGIAAVGATLRG